MARATPISLNGAIRRESSAESAVVLELAVVDDDNPLAERGDIGHVVAGQQDRRAGAAVVLLEEVADARLGGDIQADGGLIQEQHLGAVEQAGGQLALHALAQREVAHRLADDGCQVEQFVQLFQRCGNRRR